MKTIPKPIIPSRFLGKELVRFEVTFFSRRVQNLYGKPIRTCRTTYERGTGNRVRMGNRPILSIAYPTDWEKSFYYLLDLRCQPPKPA